MPYARPSRQYACGFASPCWLGVALHTGPNYISSEKVCDAAEMFFDRFDMKIKRSQDQIISNRRLVDFDVCQ